MTQTPNNESEKSALIAELQEAGIKHTPEHIIRIARQPDGKIVFLETGDKERGLEHILAKSEQFANIGIERHDIIDAVILALTEGTIVGQQGTTNARPRPIYQFTFKGETKYLSITVGTNGYIVGANPRTKLR